MEPEAATEVLIAGAGIGGLTLALQLHRVGVACRVIEAAPQIAPLGVGINILPHAARELHRLGLAEELDRVAIRTAESRFYTRHGQLVYAEPLGVAAGYPWPQYSVHRADLQGVLLAAVQERLGSDAVRLGTRLVSADQDDTGVSARVEVDGREETVRATALIGCDGVHSAVRAALHPTSPGLRYAGCTMWRGAVVWPAFLGGATLVRAGWLSTGKMVIYPIRGDVDGRGSQLVNWVAELETPQRAGRDWTNEGSIEDIIEPFADWHFDWLDVPAMIRATETVLEYPMVDQEPLSRWSFGRMTLLGDAAHPMVPRGSNGAGQAILDTRSLAERLGSGEGVVAALAAYDDERREATGEVVRMNRANPPRRDPARGLRANGRPALRRDRGRDHDRGDRADAGSLPRCGGVLAGRPHSGPAVRTVDHLPSCGTSAGWLPIRRNPAGIDCEHVTRRLRDILPRALTTGLALRVSVHDRGGAAPRDTAAPNPPTTPGVTC